MMSTVLPTDTTRVCVCVWQVNLVSLSLNPILFPNALTMSPQLQRHGARYPSKSDGKAIKKSVEKIQGASEFNSSNLTFVSDYEYTLGTDDLVAFGAAQCVVFPLDFVFTTHLFFLNRAKVIRRGPGTFRALRESRERRHDAIPPSFGQ